MSDILTLDQIKVLGTASTKADAIKEAGQILVDCGAVEQAYVDAMAERENSVSTYMGNYLAIPHGTNEAKGEIKRSAVSFVRYPTPVDWDGNEVKFAVGIAGQGDDHMDIITKLAMLFSDPDQVKRLEDARDAQEILTIFDEAEA